MPKFFIFLILIFSSLINATERVVTNPHQSDGFGSQFQSIIASVVYAELNHYRYVYTPFQAMEHNYNKEVDFLEKKEKLINFKDNFDCIDSVAGQDCNVISTINYKFFFDTNVAQCANSCAFKKIKNIFRVNKKFSNYFSNQNFNIAVHVRRPNSHDNRLQGTDTADIMFLTIINKLREVYSLKKPLFHLYSQGSIEKFKNFNTQDIVLHIDEPMEESFVAMVFADVLVVSVSSFSYTAALLSEGIVYYMPFWHNPLPHWVSVDKLLKGD